MTTIETLIRTFLRPSVPVSSLLDAAYVGDPAIVVRVFDWERDRATTLAKAVGGTASAIALAAIAAAFDGKHLSDSTVAVTMIGVAVLLVWAAVLTVGVQTLAGQYTATVTRLQRP